MPFGTDLEHIYHSAVICFTHWPFFIWIVCLLVCEGGTLTSIEDPSEQEFIHRNIKQFQDNYDSYWIGLFKTHNGTVACSFI